MGGRKEEGLSGTCKRTHGQNQRVVGSRIRSGDGCCGREGSGGREMETIVLEQQIKNVKKMLKGLI